MERLLREKLPEGRFIDVRPQHRRLMEHVKARGNRTTERRLRAALAAMGVRGWQMNVRTILGTPDFFFPGASVAVFVDGCFWHGCPTCGHVPKRNAAFWQAKIARNRQRDRMVTRALRAKGVRVVRFWEHDLAGEPKACISRLQAILKGREV